MARSRYFQTSPVQDLSKTDPRDRLKLEPLHYNSYNIPLDLAGLAPVDLIGDAEYIEHTWQPGDRLDRLANKYYNDDLYWWVIAMANAISYPLGIVPGTIIRIPVNVNKVLEKLELI
jgi:nucleoid-associated protein YgaU